MRAPDYFDRHDTDEEDRDAEPTCNRCGSTDVRWRHQGDKWVLFSMQPGVLHTCCQPSADDFEVVPS